MIWTNYLWQSPKSSCQRLSHKPSLDGLLVLFAKFKTMWYIKNIRFYFDVQNLHRMLYQNQWMGDSVLLRFFFHTPISILPSYQLLVFLSCSWAQKCSLQLTPLFFVWQLSLVERALICNKNLWLYKLLYYSGENIVTSLFNY